MPALAAVELLDEVNASIDDHTAEAVSRLTASLDAMKCSLDEGRWLEYARATCREHPLSRRLREDPFTDRAFRKPRGYPGDAELLDLIYLGLPPAMEQATTALGRRIFHETAWRSWPSRAVRARRDVLASRLDRLTGEQPGARVLSVASGRLHEARRARGVREGRLGELVAVDHDAETVAGLSDLKGVGVTAVRGSVKDIVEGRLRLSGFDFAYAAGLYDYLGDDTARRLTRALVDALRPGGELLVANFVAGFPGSAYMDSFMDWPLLVRTEDQLARCLDDVAPAAIARWRTWQDEGGCVAYLGARKA
jgi:extracellular factor (EF) 3-hydroxypalmitic acid methyl ester biosynthesis protein